MCASPDVSIHLSKGKLDSAQSQEIANKTANEMHVTTPVKAKQ